MEYVIIILVVLLLVLLASCIKIVPQAQAFVLERLGGYQATWDVGIQWKWPIIDKVATSYLKGAGCRLCSAAGYHKG